ncbi:4-amino-4-deoxy-L-arabinose transferase-like glycosyltransferase [Methylorubrum rhodinum]|uniref:4-amino-4-deoxy-L-arabinose transferase-like glycosyltransferase n=1 Tax=Methylorubrum rhodinum TaxID=29428 RepID=A0A840ZI76_9HYPH|nr:hypothetical protein [Methylorubrum rhodinum]MBB5756805.1 4-amino-4-deoxy-L-arabinose transferase-like glycosyltransferase [Methylorubrum rhodinum]
MTGHGFEARRDRVLAVVTALAGAALLALLLLRAGLKDTGLNSHGALADAFLHGRLWIESCPEIDCALYQGRTYVIFPPLPALVAMPFVALFGFPGFKGFVFLGLALSALSLLAWRAILRALGVARADALWLVAALAFASPLYQVTLRADGVWFYAQAVGFLMVTASLWAAICRKSLPLAGLFVGLAFLCRQMAIFYPLFLLFLCLPRERPLLEALRGAVKPVLLAGIPVAAALTVYFAYNYARFGSPTETGYGFIHNPDQTSFIWHRIREIGLFSREYLLFNTLYLFLQGIHFEFGGPSLTTLTGFDKAGTALLVASPWVLLAFYAKLDRVFAAGAAVIAIIAGITLLYHSNGAEQIATQRYALDWLPILIVLMARGTRPAAFAALPLLVTWGVVANLAVIAVLSAYKV